MADHQSDPTIAGMAHGGRREGAGRPPKPPDERRVKLTVHVQPETRDTLERLRARSADVDGEPLSLGEVVDRLAAEVDPDDHA